MISFTINGIKCEARESTTILAAARDNKIYIPTLCYLEGVSDIGSCRLCMVEVKGYDMLLPACRTRVAEGMEITTESEKLSEYRRSMLKLILSNHNQDCMSCPANGKCELQALCNRYDVEHAEHTGNRVKIEKKLPLLESNPYISYDPSKCIHCQRCINVCHRIACNGSIKSGRLGNYHIVEAPFGDDYRETG